VLLLSFVAWNGKAQSVETETSGAVATEVVAYEGNHQEGAMQVDYGLNVHYKAISIMVQPRLEVSSFDTHGVISDVAERSHRWVLNAREVYGQMDVSWGDIRVGKQIIKPSIINGRIRPAQWAPMDYLDPLQPERIGVPAVRLQLFDDTIDGWYAPGETVSRMPETPWRPSLLSDVSGTSSKNTTDNGYGVRLKLRIQKTELGVGFQHGQNFSPSPKTVQVGKQRQLIFVHNPVDQGFAQLSTLLSDFIFEAEAAVVSETLPDSNRTYLPYVLSLRRQWQVGLFGDTIAGSLRYVGELGGSIASKDRKFDFRRNMKRSIFGRVKYSRSDLTYQLDGAFTTHDGGSYLLQPKLTYDRNRLRIEAATGLLGGSDKTFWGEFSGNGFFRLKLRITL